MNCLRCGRTVPDQVLFCPECAQKAPPRRSLRRVDTDFDPNQEESSAEVQGLRHRISRLHRWAAALALFSLVCLGLLGYGILRTSDERAQLAAQISKANSLQAAMDDLQEDLNAANALMDSMKNNLSENEAIISKYESRTGISPDELS